jgi:hypothetical protein
LRMRVNMSAMGSVMDMVGAPYCRNGIPK